MNNFYENSDYKYNDTIITLEDYIYNNKVKCSIPSIMSLLNKTDIINTSYDNTDNNLLNKNSKISVGKIILCNYIEIFIPSIYHKDSDEIINNQIYGKKGDKFIITMVGGNPNNYKIIGRYE